MQLKTLRQDEKNFHHNDFKNNKRRAEITANDFLELVKDMNLQF